MIKNFSAAAAALVLAAAGLAACDRDPTGPGEGGNPFAQAIAAGQAHTCALDENGVAYCWGANASGQLGTGATTPSESVPTPVAGGHSFVAISATRHTTCALTADGQAYCWGLGTVGQLGNGGSTSSNVPVPVAGPERFVEISVGLHHVCALTEAGAAYCWGANAFGRLGTGDEAWSAVPVPVAGGLKFRTISVGLVHTCGLALNTNRAHCWGANSFTQIDGVRTDSSVNVPVPVAADLSFTSLQAGNTLTCGISGSNTYCWGRDNFGSRGTGTTETAVRTRSAVVGGVRFASLGISAENSTVAPMCALTSSERVYCWGANRYGQLGSMPEPADECALSAGATPFPCTGTPAPVSAAPIFVAVAAGAEHACGLTRDQEMYCWGSNESGQLGNGNPPYAWSPIPFRVAGGIRFR